MINRWLFLPQYSWYSSHLALALQHVASFTTITCTLLRSRVLWLAVYNPMYCNLAITSGCEISTLIYSALWFLVRNCLSTRSAADDATDDCYSCKKCMDAISWCGTLNTILHDSVTRTGSEYIIQQKVP